MTDNNLTIARNESIIDCNLDQDENMKFFRFVIYSILLNSIGMFGIFGNFISMLILSKHLAKSSINYLLIGLARCDLVLIITSIVIFGITPIYYYTGLLFTYNFLISPYLLRIVFPVALIAQTSSVYLTLTITLERFVAVSMPLGAKSLCTYGRARAHFYIIVVASTVYNLPRFWEIEISDVWSERFNRTIHCLGPSALRINPVYEYYYIYWAYFLFIYLLPFSCIAILNLFIYRQVRKANSERQELSRVQRREIGIATMLLCVVLVFFVCNMFPLIVNVLDVIYKINIDSAAPISNLFVILNSSVNFIIYVSFGGQFKKSFMKMFCLKSSKRYLCWCWCLTPTTTTTTTDRNSPEALTHEDSILSNGGGGNDILISKSPTNRYSPRFKKQTVGTTAAADHKLNNCHNVPIYHPIFENNSTDFDDNETEL